MHSTGPLPWLVSTLLAPVLPMLDTSHIHRSDLDLETGRRQKGSNGSSKLGLSAKHLCLCTLSFAGALEMVAVDQHSTTLVVTVALAQPWALAACES